MEYKFFEHEADIGLEAHGRTAAEAFINAARGMFALISPAGHLTAEKTFSVKLQAACLEDLLVAWLNRLLYLYDAEKVLLGRFDIRKLEPGYLEAEVSGETVDPKKHKIKTYVKAATSHQVEVDLNRMCKVRVIFDV